MTFIFNSLFFMEHIVASIHVPRSYAFSLIYFYLPSPLLTFLAPSIALSASRYGTRGVIR